MISFVICEDEKTLAKDYKSEIDKVMMNHDFESKMYYFDRYDNKFYNFVKKNNDFKVYILDIKTECGSGLDAARMIREEYDDWNSVIIIVTAYNEYKYDALSKRLMILDFINKMDNYRKYLNDCITKSIKTYDNKPNKLRYTYKNIIYNVQFKSIVYITKEPDSKKCLIYTNENRVLPYSGTIVQLYKELDDRFIKTSRSTIVNKDFISLYDCKENKIEFETGQIITDISRSNRKRVMEHVSATK